MFATLHAVTGRRLPHIVLPAAMMLPIARAASAAQRATPFHIPAEDLAGNSERTGVEGESSKSETPRPLSSSAGSWPGESVTHPLGCDQRRGVGRCGMYP
jgi:hypothetical protein